MPKPTIHFGHANGFPAKTYSHLFEGLSESFDVIHVDKFGHNPLYPVEIGWKNQVDELISFLQSRTTQPVIGVGHSLGASITIMAAAKMPELFKSLILLDPVIMNGVRGLAVSVARKLGLIDQFSPAGKSKDRRDHWNTVEDARSNFSGKALFRGFDAQSLDNYLEYGLKAYEDGYKLTFRPEIEVELFRTVPVHFDRLKGKLKHMPGVVIAGDHTNVTVRGVARRFCRQQDFEHKVIQGYHMFPLEQPGNTVKLIKQYARYLDLY